jgi:hypothetical protein
MDAQDKHESGTHRQELLAQRLATALDQLKPNDVAECPDAEIIAAFAERALGLDESAQWEGHFATCARCRNILLVLTAPADTPLAEQEVAQLGHLVSAAQAEAPAPADIADLSTVRVRPNPMRRRMRWLVPAFGVAAVIAVWVAVRPPWRTADRAASVSLMAQAPREEMPASPAPPAVDQLSNSAPQQDQKMEAAAPAGQSVEKTLPSDSSIAAQKRERGDATTAQDKATPKPSGTTSSLQDSNKLSAPVNGRQIQPRATPPPPSPKPLRGQGATNAPAASQSEAKASSNGIVGVSAPVVAGPSASAVASEPPRDHRAAAPQAQANATIAGPAKQKAASIPPSAARSAQALAVIRPGQNYSSLLKAHSSSILWRVGIAGVIERSTDAGKTWASQSSPSREDWLVGAALSQTVCWIAGRNGAIARTTDGENWQSVAPPTIFTGADGKLPDWTSIAARDAQSATIVATDGRRFATVDGGKTWQAQ